MTTEHLPITKMIEDAIREIDEGDYEYSTHNVIVNLVPKIRQIEEEQQTKIRYLEDCARIIEKESESSLEAKIRSMEDNVKEFSLLRVFAPRMNGQWIARANGIKVGGHTPLEALEKLEEALISNQ